ncbi:MAG TPA: DUF2333 family protein [Geminicoccus sp.]|jgi:hypothetical protein|uniref:DUF2333 family protein n=1 Tax=Geminicoccus sp. TaxID=2024832 RepID=UPI002E306C9D|nr:DUF2333 family protein [Geminicoccus sp.]HEX2526270.1 DUF2333 family protein [Geminicoccus sp.]
MADVEVQTTTRRPLLRRLLLGVPALIVLAVVGWYLVGMIVVHRIDDDPNFAVASTAPPNGSRTVAAMADLIEREIDVNEWTPNEPFFKPGVLLDNMPSYQTGLVAAVQRFGVSVRDRLARARGSSQADADLTRAMGLLAYPGNVWVWNPAVSWAPTATTESQYRQAVQALRAYNLRLGAGEASLERRGDNLMDTLDAVASDLGSTSAAISQAIDNNRNRWFDFYADDLFYTNKGQLYAYYILLRELGLDYADVIRERGAGSNWAEMLDSFQQAATVQPWVVVNGGLDSQFKPNHLANQGFLLLRARTQLREVTNILLR